MENVESNKIALVKLGNFSHVNENMIELFPKLFPGHELRVIDVQDDIVSVKNPVNIISSLKEYNLNFMFKRKYIKRYLCKSTSLT